MSKQNTDINSLRDPNSQWGVSGQFFKVAREILSAGPGGPNWKHLAEKFSDGFHGRALSLCKAAVAGADTSLWGTPDGQALSVAYLREVAGGNLLDAIKRYAMPLPTTNMPAFIASGIVGSDVTQGSAKPLSRLELTAAETERGKVAAMVVVSDEVARSNNLDAMALIRQMLRDAVIEASNRAVLTRLASTSIAAGSTVLESLKLGLAAAAPSRGYVVAATAAACRELALESDGRMGVSGGDFIEGVTIVPALEGTSNGHALTVIPAGSWAVRDYGLDLRSAGHATVQMDNEPTGKANAPVTGHAQTSLFQVNAVGMMIERFFDVRSSATSVEVG